jgi:hypothetical protein
MSERARQPLSQRLRPVPVDRGPTERSGGERVSELASESVSQRIREAPTERSEGEW